MIQYRAAVDGLIRDIDESKRQVQIVIPHERIDSYNTDFSRECFRESFQRALPKMAWMHQKHEPIGHGINAQITSEANELIEQFSDFDAVPRAKQAFVQIRDGDVTDFSFGFDNASSIAHPDVKGAIRFTRANMHEVSPVMAGAIPGAVAVGVRSQVTQTEVLELVRAKVISPEEGHAMLLGAGMIPILGKRDDEQDETEDEEPAPERERIEVRADQPAGDDGDRAEDDPDAELTEDEAAEAERAADEIEAGDRADKKPNGDVAYADPKNGKYPIDTAEHVRAAWSYINQADNAAKYPLNGVTLSEVKDRIRAAAKKFGIDIAGRSADDEWLLRELQDTSTRLAMLAVR